MQTTTTTLTGTTLEADIRSFLAPLGYSSCGASEALDWVATHGTATDCPMIDPDDQAVVNELVMRHVGHVEFESAADWPSVYDEHVWATTEDSDSGPGIEPASVEPNAEDREWWAREMERIDTEDAEWTAAAKEAIDAMMECGGGFDDDDMQRVGAVG